MKTCEEYVLKRLEELEKQNEKIRKEKEELLAELNVVKEDQKLLIAIGDKLEIKESDGIYNRVYFYDMYILSYPRGRKGECEIFGTLKNRVEVLKNGQE